MSKPSSMNSVKWETCDLTKIFSLDSLNDITSEEVQYEPLNGPASSLKCEFPDFGANQLQQTALTHVCAELGACVHQSVCIVNDIPSVVVAERMCAVWDEVLQTCSIGTYSAINVKRVLAAIQKEERSDVSSPIKVIIDAAQVQMSEEKVAGDTILIEMGIKTSLSLVFSLFKQTWSQFVWQRQLQQALSQSLSIGPVPALSLPNDVLKSVLDMLTTIPPLALSNSRTLSRLGQDCLKQSTEFLQWSAAPASNVDAEGKRLALQIMLSLGIQYGSLVQILQWVEDVLILLAQYQKGPHPCIDIEYCKGVLAEIRIRTQLGSEGVEYCPFSPESENGQVYTMDFLQFLLRELSEVANRSTSFFNKENEDFISEACEVYGFGSNSSKQLAMQSPEKLHTATLMPHMANVQVIEAGQCCSFLIYGDGLMKACGKNSYGRLGIGNFDSQASLKPVITFPPGVTVKKVASSKGSDGHSLAITAEGHVYSWGDGDFGKLGHGDVVSHKVPKHITSLEEKVVVCVACGNRHSAAVTAEGELYTWGDGDRGRLGHGNAAPHKVPTKVSTVTRVKQVSCGASHTLALSMDGLTVWSFGSGDGGKLGHGNTTTQMFPTAIEALEGIVCQKVCAAGHFSLVLSAGGKVYSFGNGSGVGRGNTEPQQTTPWLMDALEKEMIIDISTGDGHCLALTRRGEVFSWGTNSMGQCGQGHSNGSILRPSKVQSLDGIQIQQISTGTSHSLVWTAIPCNRPSSALWYWPYCISVEEETFKKLLSLLDKFGDFSSKKPTLPFQSMKSQGDFMLSLLSLLRIHLSLLPPLGTDYIHTACGSSIKHLRKLLFNLVDLQLPTSLVMEMSRILEVGSSILLPPVHGRLELIHSILPEDPLLFADLTIGQRQQLDILLQGFAKRADFVGIFAEEVHKFYHFSYDGIDFYLVNKLFELNFKMMQYLKKATLSRLHDVPLPPEIQLGSPLLNVFQNFVTSTYINICSVLIPLHDEGCNFSEGAKKILIHHLAPFDHLLKESSLSTLQAIRSAAARTDDPLWFLQNKQDVVFGYLAYQYPCHIALSCSWIPMLDSLCDTGAMLLELAEAVHQLISFLPSTLILQLEREELLWDRKEGKVDLLTLREPCEHPWRRLLDYERLLCYHSAKLNQEAYVTPLSEAIGVLNYTPRVVGKGQVNTPTLLNSHLLRNGAIGDTQAIIEAIYTWVSLCKALPEATSPRPISKEASPPTILSWSSYLTDYNFLLKSGTSPTYCKLEKPVSEIGALDPTTASMLHCLAVGGAGNDHANRIYANMMEFAQHRDWNTCSDEKSVPELKQVSCAALACLLKHTGLSHYASNHSSKPKKKLIDVYHCVFSLRRETFTHRPIPDTEGRVSPDDEKKFNLQCSGICVTLLFLMCVLEPAIPENTDPIIPQSKKKTSSLDNGSPKGSLYHSSGAIIPLISHSLSLTESKLEYSQDTSLLSVKKALSYIRWHHDRLDHLKVSSGAEPEEHLHLTVCHMVIDIVCQVFTPGEPLLDRVKLIKALLDHQQRAENRLKCLKRVLHFFSNCDFFLPSSQLLFKSTCLAHEMHYLDDITVAPSVLQHEVKSLSHDLLLLIIKKLLAVSTTDLFEPLDSTLSGLALKRELLLAIQWINFEHQASDLQFFFSAELYGKLAELSSTPNTSIEAFTHSTRLWTNLKKSCTLMMQLLAMQVGLNVNILKLNPEILEDMLEHLFGQLKQLVDNTATMSVMKDGSSVEEKDVSLGNYLGFLNTLCATHATIKTALASDSWLGTLLKVVDVDISTGKFALVTSLKTRLITLELLGTIMSECTDKSAAAEARCMKIIKDLLRLMFRCMFMAPATNLQQAISDVAALSQDCEVNSTVGGRVTSMPFLADMSHQKSVECTAEGNGCLVVSYRCTSSGYFIGAIPMTIGKYTWKVTIESAECVPNFVVGVSKKPLTLTDHTIETSDEIWVISSKGEVRHSGEIEDTLQFNLTEGGSIELRYNASRSQGALLCNYGHGFEVILSGISKTDGPVYPIFIFQRNAANPASPVRIRFHPILHTQISSFSDLRYEEKLESGYPDYSPINFTLSGAIVSLLYQLQGKEPWNRAIAQVISRELAELDTSIHHLLSIEEKLVSPTDKNTSSDTSLLSSLSLVMSELLQIAWPVLTVMGGLDCGYCLGRPCKLEGETDKEEEVLIASTSDTRHVTVQKKPVVNTTRVMFRVKPLAELHLISLPKFSLIPLIVNQLTPSILLNLAHLAGFLGQHSIPSILEEAHNTCSVTTKELMKCLPYQLTCHSLLQMAATRALCTLLLDESVIALLNYQPPSLSVVMEGGCKDLSELAATVVDVLKCLSARATKPSPLKPAIRLLELQKLHSTLSYESIVSIAEYISNPDLPSDKEKANSDEVTDLSFDFRTSPGSLSYAVSQSNSFEYRGSEEAQTSTPSMETVLIEMGFSHPQVSVAMERCEIPENTTDQSRMQLLVSWIIENPLTAEEEETQLLQIHTAERQQRNQELVLQMQASQTAAMDELLSMMIDPCPIPSPAYGTEHEGSKLKVQHAPDLLEGPDVSEEVPDINLSGLDTSSDSFKSLLSALGLTQKKPTPQIYEFKDPDPMGEEVLRASREGMKNDIGEGTKNTTVRGEFFRISKVCTDLMGQVQRLKSMEENMTALKRIASAAQTLIARHVTVTIIANLTTQPAKNFISSLKKLDLLDIQSLVRLFRLVHAGRINGTLCDSFTPSNLCPFNPVESLSTAITTVITEERTPGGAQLVQSCSKDLLAAAVGGPELIKRAGRRRDKRRRKGSSLNSRFSDGKSDVSILSNPSFAVSRRLVQTLAKFIGKMAGGDLHSTGIVEMMDALAACLFSLKLRPNHRFWALEQLIRVFAATSGSAKKDQCSTSEQKDLVLPSQLEHFIGHKGQILACIENAPTRTVISIGEGNNMIMWDFLSGSIQPETTSLPFPSTPFQSSPHGLLLPVLSQSSNGNCVASALDKVLCVWKIKDGKSITQSFSGLITAFQFKLSQYEGEFPMILVGLIDGELILAEVLKASAHLTPEIHLTSVGKFIKGAVCCLSWSPHGAQFAVGYTTGHIQVFRGAGREYTLVSETRDFQMTSLSWSPGSHYLTTLDKCGLLQLRRSTPKSLSVSHSFDSYPTNSFQWHSVLSDSGTMLLASGGRNGVVHLWLVKDRASDSEEIRVNNSSSSASTNTVIMSGVVSHITSLEGHPAPITSLVFNESAVILASACKAGSVRVWDISSFERLKFATRTVGEVISLTWTKSGLAICYKNTSSLCMLPPGPEDYLAERCLHNCLPLLNYYSIQDLGKVPCLTAFLKNLHHTLLNQYQYEHAEVLSSEQLVHSEYLQQLTALTVGLGLHTILISPPYPPHTPPPPTPSDWIWLADFSNALDLAESLIKRTPLSKDIGFTLPKNSKSLESYEKYQPTANSVWTLEMDVEILEWVNQRPEDWWPSYHSTVYTWGKGTHNQLGHSTSDNAFPAVVREWTDVQQIVAGNHCTYAIKSDGSISSVGDGSYGRLGHGTSDDENIMRVISSLQGIPVVQVVAGPRVSMPADDGFALALTDSGNVYSWGKDYRGRLGHPLSENIRSPKLIDAFLSKDVKMIACGDYHCAAVTESGRIFTFGSKENGKLGHGRDAASGYVNEVTKFLDVDEQTLILDVKIGYVSCGKMFTLAITEDGSQVFAWGKADNCAFGLRNLIGDHHYPLLLSHLSPIGPFVKSVSGNRSSSLLTVDGRLWTFGKLYDELNEGGIPVEYVTIPGQAKVVDMATAASYVLALTENDDVYYWGKQLYGTETSGIQNSPRLIPSISGKGIKQISAAVWHCAACNSTLPVKGMSTTIIPSAVPAQFSALRDIDCDAIYARLFLLKHFSKLISKSWALFSSSNKNKADLTRYHLNPLLDSETRSLLSAVTVEGMVAGVLNRTMTRKSHGPSITIQRIVADGNMASKPVFPQIAAKIIQLPASELRCPARAWKVNLLGEGADDAGGVFDETIAQMSEELENGVVKLLIPAPNATNKCSFNADRFVFNPKATVAKYYNHLKFLGILFGVAMRTKKPLDLHLAQPMWKLLVGMSLTPDDLEEVDLMFIQMLWAIRDAHKNGIEEEDFSAMIPIESFEAQSMTGRFIPIIPGGSNIKLTFQNRKEYVEKALQFRLHELDEQVAVIREGMSCIVPVPLLSLYTPKMLEHAICGREKVDLTILKKIVRYREDTSEDNDVIQWLWQTLESFPNEERVLFLRFISGRSRLPVRISDVPHRFQISVSGQSDESLPTSQTCFFQLRLPKYSSCKILCERLRYAIRNCRSIDMDNYMLQRTGSSGSDFYDSNEDGDL